MYRVKSGPGSRVLGPAILFKIMFPKPLPANDESFDLVWVNDGPNIGWHVRDEEGAPIMRLPESLDEDEARDVARYVIPQLKSDFNDGVRAGAREERQKIAYGFSVVLGPVIASLEKVP